MKPMINPMNCKNEKLRKFIIAITMSLCMVTFLIYSFF